MWSSCEIRARKKSAVVTKIIGVALAAVLIAAHSGGARAAHTYQTADMVDFDTGVVENGAGTLTRTASEVWASFSGQGLDPKAAYTVWWVIFNNPEECVVPAECGESDLFNLDVEAAVFYAAGFVTGTDGVANISFHLRADDIGEDIDVVIGDGSVIGGPNSCGPGTDCDTGVPPILNPGNGYLAEIHLVIRTHSKTITGSVAEQIGSFLGACDVTTCADQQAVVFSPNPPGP